MYPSPWARSQSGSVCLNRQCIECQKSPKTRCVWMTDSKSMTKEMDRMTPTAVCVCERNRIVLCNSFFIHTDTLLQIPWLYFIFGMRENEIFVNCSFWFRRQDIFFLFNIFYKLSFQIITWFVKKKGEDVTRRKLSWNSRFCITCSGIHVFNELKGDYYI